jgi:DNA invertase Pin-like site-specific DNA recombinase
VHLIWPTDANRLQVDRDPVHEEGPQLPMRVVVAIAAKHVEVDKDESLVRRSAAREARRARGQSIGRPGALDASKAALAQRMHAGGESASTVAAALGVSRATVYRVLAEGAD